MPTNAKVIQDSISESGVRLTTLVLEYPRIIHSEFMTHRMFSRNASSSRAIPVIDNINRVSSDGFEPAYLGKNQKGMQASEEVDQNTKNLVQSVWNQAKRSAIFHAEQLNILKVHKQLANRVLEPFNYIQVVVTATEWDNFFLQRLDKNAQPEIQELARAMKLEMDNSTPKLLKTGEWHLPFIENKDAIYKEIYKHWYANGSVDYLKGISMVDLSIRVSVARCARVSYGLNERGWGDIEKDLALYDMLASSAHWSPFEHQATPIKTSESAAHYDLITMNGVTHMDYKGALWSGNFKGWVQNRQLIQQI